MAGILQDVDQEFGLASQKALLPCRDFAKVIGTRAKTVDEFPATVVPVIENVIIMYCDVQDGPVQFLGHGFRDTLVLAVRVWIGRNPAIHHGRHEELPFARCYVVS